jgi:S-adenosylmethionine/arginine decarboxylase-like enzyme
MNLDHRHILVKASGLTDPPREVQRLSDWLVRLVAAVDMKVLMGPYTVRCETAGNEGCTGAIVIETSHASLHCWDTVSNPFLQMDLYSCAHFDSEAVINLIKEFFPCDISWMVIDRSDVSMRVIETGQWNTRCPS